MEKEETLLRKRLIELSNNAYQRGIIMYSDFLNLNGHPNPTKADTAGLHSQSAP